MTDIELEELEKLDCVTDYNGASKLPENATKALLLQIPSWELDISNGTHKLVRRYALKDFAHALRLANHIGDLAQQQDHHPTLEVTWGKLAVSWWTHSVLGLHLNDFIMAAKCDAVAAQYA